MAIPIWAGHYIGLPFREHGRDRTGCDCWGLVRMVLAEQYDIFVESFAGNYAHTKDAETIGELVRDISKLWIPVPKGQEECGDVIVLRNRGQPMHIGIVLGGGVMLHVCAGIDAALENYRRSIVWKDRVHGFYQHVARG